MKTDMAAATIESAAGRLPARPAEGAAVVRRLERGDYDRGFLEALSSLRPTELSRGHFERIFDALGDRCRVWVLEVDGTIAATCTLLLEQKFIHAGGLVGHVEDVAVHARWQGRGAGRTLLKRVIDDAREAGCYKVILDCGADVAGFYESLGFRRHEIEMRLDL